MPGIRLSRGYTLLEVIAALAILGFGLSILCSGYLEAARQEDKYAETTAALTVARTILAQAEAGAGGGPGSYEGYTWSVNREPLAEPGLDRLTVTVAWGTGGLHSLQVWAVIAHGP